MDAFKKHGTLCEFAHKDRTTLKRALCERAAKQYISLDMATADWLVERCGTDYASLIHEIDKLCAYVRSGEITKQDIDLCCIPSIESSAFDLAKSVLSANYDRAFSILDNLFFLRQEPVAILGALSMTFADLYRAKCALAAGVTADQTASDFSYPKNRLFASLLEHMTSLEQLYHRSGMFRYQTCTFRKFCRPALDGGRKDVYNKK